MNAPNRFELYTLGDGEKLLDIQEDTKIPNAATFKVLKQDHTMANMIRAQLLHATPVLFAGYKLPHPLMPYFLLKIQTDGSITPAKALEEACTALIASLQTLKTGFDREFEMREEGDMGLFGSGAANGAFGSGTGGGAGGYGGYGGDTRGVGDYLDFGGA